MQFHLLIKKKKKKSYCRQAQFYKLCFVYLVCKEDNLVLPLPQGISSQGHHFYNYWHTKHNCSIKLLI